MSNICVYLDGETVSRPMTKDEQAVYDASLAAIAVEAATAARADMTAYLDSVRDLRERVLNRLAGIGLAALVASDQATVDACVAARQRLLDITKAPGVDAAADTDSLEAAIKAEYASIVASVPDSLKTAFDQLDQ